MPKYTRNDDGTSTLETEGGYKVHLIDPDGSFERSMTPEGVAAVTAPAARAPEANPLAGVSAQDAAALAQPSSVGPMNNPEIVPDRPPVAPTVAPLGAPAAGGPKAVLSDGGGGPAMASQTSSQTTNQHSESTSGMDKASKAKLLGAADKTRGAMDEAAAAERQAGENVAAQRQARAAQDFKSGYIKQVGALEAEDRYKADYDAAMKERAAAHAQKADPEKAWGGEKQEWAFIAGLGGALAALDTGIGRLNSARGRGYQVEPFDMISKMVDASLKQQEQERTHRLEAAGESAETARVGGLKAASDAKEAAAQVLDARKLLASSAEEAQFLDSAAAKMRLQRDMHDEEIAKATATQSSVTNARNTVTSTQTGPEKTAKMTKAAHDDQANLRQLYRIRDTLRRAEKTGALSSVVGYKDIKPLGFLPSDNDVKRTFGMMDPGEQEASTALGELEIGNLMRLVREPNNKNTQNMVQSLGMPKSDAEIGTSLSRLDQLIADQEDAVKNAAPEAPAEQAEAY